MACFPRLLYFIIAFDASRSALAVRSPANSMGTIEHLWLVLSSKVARGYRETAESQAMKFITQAGMIVNK